MAHGHDDYNLSLRMQDSMHSCYQFSVAPNCGGNRQLSYHHGPPPQKMMMHYQPGSSNLGTLLNQVPSLVQIRKDSLMNDSFGNTEKAVNQMSLLQVPCAARRAEQHRNQRHLAASREIEKATLAQLTKAA